MKFFLSVFLFLLAISVIVSITMQPVEVIAGDVNDIGIKVMQKEELGKFLASGDGMTLYYYTKDETNLSHCVEGCAFNWPPFYVDPAAIFEGCESSDFDTIKRGDGKKQTTYKNMPLYHFINDKYPGDTLGQGIGKVWFIVTP
jgi:predicted lipoprotein with Yx(FWY)xxD motif